MKELKSDDIPDSLAILSKATKSQLLEELTDEPFKDAITSVLLGRNIREFTEQLTRSRLFRSYVETVKMFLEFKSKGYAPAELAAGSLAALQKKRSDLSATKRNVLQWIVGLNGKLSQNLLRDSVGTELSDFVDGLVERIEAEAKSLGKTTFEVRDEAVDGSYGNGIVLDGKDLITLLNIIGAQTLSIRGSEKSLHGKNFERLVLGSVFQLLGFTLTDFQRIDPQQPSFYLSSQDERSREADATVLYRGQGVRIDIGFIGRGNTEISLDKVTRYTRRLEIFGASYRMHTIVIVDRIGDRSKIDRMAKEIEGIVLRMSDSDWVLALSSHLKKIFNSNRVGLPTQIDDSEALERYVADFMRDLDISNLLE